MKYAKIHVPTLGIGEVRDFEGVYDLAGQNLGDWKWVPYNVAPDPVHDPATQRIASSTYIYADRVEVKKTIVAYNPKREAVSGLLANRAVRGLIRAINKGTLPVGANLTEQEIADRIEREMD